MKKTKLVAMLLSMVLMLSVLLTHVFADIAEGSYFGTYYPKTAVTETSLLASHYVTSYYFPDGSREDVAIAHAEFTGGPLAHFKSDYHLSIWGFPTVVLNSDYGGNTNEFDNTIRVAAEDVEYNAHASIIFGTTSRTDSEDTWVGGYRYYWISPEEGWRPE